MATPYADCSIGRFSELVAAREPAPGGGPVAAVTVSLAAALVAMAARYSPDVEGNDELVQTAEQLRSRAMSLADADADAYQAVIEAYAFTGAGHPAQRRELISSALYRAAAVVLEVADAGAETARLAARLAADGNRSTRDDAVTAVLLAEAATRAAAHLVAVDVKAGGSDPRLVREAERTVEMARAASLSAPLMQSPGTRAGTSDSERSAAATGTAPRWRD